MIAGAVPTVFGLVPQQVHDRFWASRGVQVVRRGMPSEIVRGAELYLLTDPRSLVYFPLRDLLETLSWLEPQVLFLRIRDRRERGYREGPVLGGDGRIERFERLYSARATRMARVALTEDPELARAWQNTTTPAEGWRRLRHLVPLDRRSVRRLPGHAHDAADGADTMDYLRLLLDAWKRPDATMTRARRGPGGVWADESAAVDRGVTVLGPAWVGAGRKLGRGDVVVGPAVLWDDPAARPALPEVDWQDLEPVEAPFMNGPPRAARAGRPGKRVFDVLFSLFALTVTLPFWPIIILAIILEDGWPPFFVHRRETLGGRFFPCIKFRSMRKGASREAVAGMNLADGPQVYLKDDPRATRVGRILRATKLDELPQFLNVLAGHMSVIGPRPSPFDENQFCPGWREARLSVRPGITGLWQVCRTRAQGQDFQEWIRYDLEYVARNNWRLDLWIFWRTIVVMLLGRKD